MRGGNWCLRCVLVVQFATAVTWVEQSHAAAFQNLNFEDVVLQPSMGNPLGLPDVIDVPGWSFSEFDPPYLLWHIGNTPQQFLLSDLLDDNGIPIGTPLE